MPGQNREIIQAVFSGSVISAGFGKDIRRLRSLWPGSRRR
jgi:hypothetical protein